MEEILHLLEALDGWNPINHGYQTIYHFFNWCSSSIHCSTAMDGARTRDVSNVRGRHGPNPADSRGVDGGDGHGQDDVLRGGRFPVSWVMSTPD